MPANAAAWYMAKRKFYMNQPLDQQLLPFLLKKYPEKFRVIGGSVIFLEVSCILYSLVVGINMIASGQPEKLWLILKMGKTFIHFIYFD